jgi:hypothetical protein
MLGAVVTARMRKSAAALPYSAAAIAMKEETGACDGAPSRLRFGRLGRLGGLACAAGALGDARRARRLCGRLRRRPPTVRARPSASRAAKSRASASRRRLPRERSRRLTSPAASAAQAFEQARLASPGGPC